VQRRRWKRDGRLKEWATPDLLAWIRLCICILIRIDSGEAKMICTMSERIDTTLSAILMWFWFGFGSKKSRLSYSVSCWAVLKKRNCGPAFH
jgi:hypothetical protein